MPADVRTGKCNHSFVLLEKLGNIVICSLYAV